MNTKKIVEYICPYDTETFKINKQDRKFSTTTDYCETTALGRGCAEKDTCISYLEAKKKEFEVTISEKDSSI